MTVSTVGDVITGLPSGRGGDLTGPAGGRGVADPQVPPVTREHLRQALRDLGGCLSKRRRAIDFKQVELADRVGYSRSTVAGAETGYGRAHRGFWEACDRELSAGGELLAEFLRVDALARAYNAQTNRERQRRRNERFRDDIQQTTPAAEPMSGVSVCDCPLTVVRWTGCETRALREALRLSIPDFATRLGFSATSVASWESRDNPAGLRLATQRDLDTLLKRVDADTRVRLRAILRERQNQHAGRVRVIDRHVCGTSRATRSRRSAPSLVHNASRLLASESASTIATKGD
ncbi:helix-turn-helix domain-containing protein [Plantactinospora sp. KLBMP9567]|uniref:helix-turn-helix domain-containing protein n=1 Tax=Plantactinospora sp. KLBMP9567 TaxID=3085900 RepID=UPI003990D1B8